MMTKLASECFYWSLYYNFNVNTYVTGWGTNYMLKPVFCWWQDISSILACTNLGLKQIIFLVTANLVFAFLKFMNKEIVPKYLFWNLFSPLVAKNILACYNLCWILECLFSRNRLVTSGLPSQRTIYFELWCFFLSLAAEQTVKLQVIWDAMILMWCNCDTDWQYCNGIGRCDKVQTLFLALGWKIVSFFLHHCSASTTSSYC